MYGVLVFSCSDMNTRLLPLDGYGGSDSGVLGMSSSPPSSSPGVHEPASEGATKSISDH